MIYATGLVASLFRYFRHTRCEREAFCERHFFAFSARGWSPARSRPFKYWTRSHQAPRRRYRRHAGHAHHRRRRSHTSHAPRLGAACHAVCRDVTMMMSSAAFHRARLTTCARYSAAQDAIASGRPMRRRASNGPRIPRRRQTDRPLPINIHRPRRIRPPPTSLPLEGQAFPFSPPHFQLFA